MTSSHVCIRLQSFVPPTCLQQIHRVSGFLVCFSFLVPCRFLLCFVQHMHWRICWQELSLCLLKWLKGTIEIKKEWSVCRGGGLCIDFFSPFWFCCHNRITSLFTTVWETLQKSFEKEFSTSQECLSSFAGMCAKFKEKKNPILNHSYSST